MKMLIALMATMATACSYPEPGTAAPARVTDDVKSASASPGDEERSDDDADIVSTVSTPLSEALALDAAGLFEEKIVGGRDAVPGEDPWQVALVAGIRRDTNVVFCGGSLIAQRWVLTAAHCVDRGMVPAQVDVVSGTVNLDSGGARTRVIRIIIHPRWDRPSHNNDVALLELAGNPIGRPIAMASASIEASLLRPGASLRVSGWGRTMQGGQKVRRLRVADVPFVSRADCNDRVSYNGAITDLMFCAGWQRGGVDSCQGDSGGPLTAAVGAARMLTGVVSWGKGCAQPNKYGVYARVAAFQPWAARCIAGQDCSRGD